MLLGGSPAAGPMLLLAPIMPQWDLSGRCFLQAAPVNADRSFIFQLSCCDSPVASSARLLSACSPPGCLYQSNSRLTGPLCALQRPPLLPA